MANYKTVVGHAAHEIAGAVTTGAEAATSDITLTGIKPGDTPMMGLLQRNTGTGWAVITGGAITVSGYNTINISSPTSFPTDSIFVLYYESSPIP